MSVALTIDEATPADVLALQADLLPSDAAELAAAGLTVQQALAGAAGQALRQDGQLLALFGLTPHPERAGWGIPWMLSTAAIQAAPGVLVLDLARGVVHGWQERCDVLVNLIHQPNARALRFIRWLGFTVHPEPAGPGGLFHLFTWSRDV